MERAEFLNRMRSMAQTLYDHFAYKYWTEWGSEIDAAHREYLAKFLARIDQPGLILSAACGAGRFDGLLMEAGHHVLGIDQSAGVLDRAREHFPADRYPHLRYEKTGLQEMDFYAAFDGLICMDAMEHIAPEDWPVIVRNFAKALKPGAPLYLTADARDAAELKRCYENALAKGLPVVFGEIADEVESAYQEALETGAPRDQSVYHFIPAVEQIQGWFEEAELRMAEVGETDEYHHLIAVKPS